jgi:hypothetical protein
MNDKDFANSVSQDKITRCLSAFARFCAESPGKANKLEYPLTERDYRGREKRFSVNAERKVNEIEW